MSSENAMIIRSGLCVMQVCVPNAWTTQRIEAFANANNCAGISSRWKRVKKGHSSLAGTNSKVPCAERKGYSHHVLVC